MLKSDLYRGWYLPSNGTIANIVLHDLDLNVQGHRFETLTSRKQWELSHKCVIGPLPRFVFAIEWHHCECCIPWPWRSFSWSNISCYAFAIKHAQSADVPSRFASTRTALAVELLLFLSSTGMHLMSSSVQSASPKLVNYSILYVATYWEQLPV